ncbi:MAG: hypothetical protein ABSB69_03825 [Solirubrobacteraceae bacterium]
MSAPTADVLARVHGEIDARLRQLRPAVAEYERLLGAAAALDAEARARPAAKPPPTAKARPAAKQRQAAKARPAAKPRPVAKARLAARPGRAPMARAEQAIVAALEHGSHTVGELGAVTAMSGGEIREGVRRLLKAGKVARAKREGRAAYALSGTA